MIKINLVRQISSAGAAKRSGGGPEFSLGAKQGDILLMSMLGLALIVGGGRWWTLNSELKELKRVESDKRTERDSLQQYIAKVDELEARREALRSKIQIINDLKTNQQGPVRILDEVSRALPDLVWLTNLKFDGKTLTLNGMAMDENAVANYIANLDASPFFQEPQLRDLSRQAQAFSFTLSCQFTNAPPAIQTGR
jgi:type IV pilus assembly protein PilN